MAEKHSCLIQHTFVVILILSAVSFLGHFVMDAAPDASAANTACGLSETQKNSFSSSDTSQASVIHGGFLLATLSEPSCPTSLLFEGDLQTSESPGRAPATPVRPPISS
jgi:hypothetical protein